MNKFIDIFNDSTLTPGTIYGIGRNYAEHAAELRNEVPAEPLVFLKSQASLRPLAEGGLAYPDEVFHHEAEVVVLIGRNLSLGTEAGWKDVAGLGLGLDLTRREAQAALKAKGLPWTKAKCFLGAAPLSPFVPVNQFPHPEAIAFSLHVQDKLRQQGSTKDMLHSVPSLMNHLLTFTPLRAGDLIFTGTPPGVGPIQKGDRFVLRFSDLGLEFAGQL